MTAAPEVIAPSATPAHEVRPPAADATTTTTPDSTRRPVDDATGTPSHEVVDETMPGAADDVAEPRPRPRRRHHGVTRPAPPAPAPDLSGDPVQQTAMAVRSLTAGVNRFRGALADALEISPTDVLALTEVSLAPTTAAALTPGELAERIGVGIAGTSTVIDKLVRAGFLRRNPSTLDRRTYTLGLTPAGTHAVGWIWDATRAVIADATDATDASGKNSPRPEHTATITALHALAAAYYRHADTLHSG